jgi:hypothetical protein
VAVEAAAFLTHKIDYTILDQNFDAATSSMVLWRACGKEFGGWSDKQLAEMRQAPPIYAEPSMEAPVTHASLERPWIHDKFDEVTEFISLRRETFSMPTVERNRILN